MSNPKIIIGSTNKSPLKKNLSLALVVIKNIIIAPTDIANSGHNIKWRIKISTLNTKLV